MPGSWPFSQQRTRVGYLSVLTLGELRKGVEAKRRTDSAVAANTKKRLSAFYPTDLDFLLRNLDVRTVVLNGGFTDCCILNAAFDASNLGYNLVVLRDLDSADLLDRWRNEGSFTPAEQLSGGRRVVMHPE